MRRILFTVALCVCLSLLQEARRTGICFVENIAMKGLCSWQRPYRLSVKYPAQSIHSLARVPLQVDAKAGILQAE